MSFQAPRFTPSLGGAPPSWSRTDQPVSVRVEMNVRPARAVGFSSMGVSVPLFWSSDDRHSIFTVLGSTDVWANFSRRVRLRRRVVSPFPSRTIVSNSRVDPNVTVVLSVACTQSANAMNQSMNGSPNG